MVLLEQGAAALDPFPFYFSQGWPLEVPPAQVGSPVPFLAHYFHPLRRSTLLVNTSQEKDGCQEPS